MAHLQRPDERTARALKNLRADRDFSEVLAWLEHSLGELDRAKRVTIPVELLRQQQGAAQAIAEMIAHANGRQVQAIDRVRATPLSPGMPGV